MSICSYSMSKIEAELLELCQSFDKSIDRVSSLTESTYHCFFNSKPSNLIIIIFFLLLNLSAKIFSIPDHVSKDRYISHVS